MTTDQLWHHLQASSVPQSQSHAYLNHPSLLATAASVEPSLHATQSSSLCPAAQSPSPLHGLHLQLRSYLWTEFQNPPHVLYIPLQDIKEATSSTIDLIAAAPIPSLIIRFKNPSFLTSNRNLTDSIFRAVTAVALEWSFGHLFTNSLKQASNCCSIRAVTLQFSQP